MRFFKKLVRSVLLFALLSAFLLPQVFAVGVSVSASSSPVLVGGTVTVTVTFSQANIGSVAATFSYDSSVLQYTGGSNSSNGKIAAVASGSGQNSLTATMSFTALKTGSSSVSVSCGSAYDFDENPVSGGSGSTSITVNASSSPSTSPSSTPSHTSSPSKSPSPSKSSSPSPSVSQPTLAETNIEAEVLNVGVRYLYKKLPANLSMPEGYARADISYHNETIQAVSNAAGVVLVYAVDEAGKNAAFFIYNKETDQVYSLIKLTIPEKAYTLLQIPSDTEIPPGYAFGEMMMGDLPLSAFISIEGANSYILYACTTSGDAQLYQYDAENGFLYPYVAPLEPTEVAGPTPSEQEAVEPAAETESEDGTLTFLLAAGCTAFFVATAALTVALLSRKKTETQVK